MSKTNYGQRGCKEAVWRKAKCIKGKDPTEYRKCCQSNKEIRFSHHGKTTPYGWHIDHKIPKAKGGSDSIDNLQAVFYATNICMGASLASKPKILREFHDAIREKRGITRSIKNLSFKWSKDLCGNLVWVKGTPSSEERLATLIDYDRTTVYIRWDHTKWDDRIPLDKDLFRYVV